ncbi:MAG: hypothetical protein AAGF28_03740 [Pseudomonadota bacterium]
MAKKPQSENAPISPIGKRLTALEKPQVIQRMIYGLAVFCLLLFLADFMHIRHGKFEIEDLLGFYGFYGFAAFAFIIFATKFLKTLIGRDEDYYGTNAVDREDYPDAELDVKDFSRD